MDDILLVIVIDVYNIVVVNNVIVSVIDVLLYMGELLKLIGKFEFNKVVLILLLVILRLVW